MSNIFNRSFIFKLCLLVLLSVKLMACMSTRHTGYSDQTKNSIPYERTVQYELSDQYYSHAPRCITILDMVDPKQKLHPQSEILEAAFARHLHAKVDKVIGPLDRKAITRKMVVDLSHPQDRKLYARNMRCGYFLSLRALDDEGDYLFFWNREAVGAEAILTSTNDQEVLWKARHVADRQDGGVPLSPISAAISLFEASSLSTDGDVNHSLSDDLARRILETLPGLRTTAATW